MSGATGAADVPAPAPTGPGLDEATARRRFVAVSFLFWLPIGMSLAPAVLLFTERGMGLAAVAGFFAAHSLTAAAMELPTGGFSDVIGRRAVLATAGLLNLTALTLLGLTTAAWVFILGMALMGSARALSSGPAEAWYVDTVHAAAGPDADVRTGLARGSSAVSVALALGTLLGGALPWLLGLGPDPGAWLTDATSGLVLPLSVPALLGAVVEVVFVLHVLRALSEPPRPKATLRTILSGVPAAVAEGLRLGARDALVRRVLLAASAAGAALAALELLTPGRAAALTGAAESGAVLFAGLACAGFVCSALGSQLAPAAARWTGSSERAALLGLGAGAAGLALLGITASTASSTDAFAAATAAAGYGLVYLGLGIAGPNENDLLHRRVDSSGRATALSVQSLALQLCGAAAGLVAGVLPLGPLPWLLAAAVLLAGALLWLRRAAPEPPENVRLDQDTPITAPQEARPHARPR
ncbi:MFS transporter [Streptomyces sp. C11-1]|uniref:MFS transporter n=1 Tax=Streptomyces durocortorensis TaxID=2811104 RepID=A0ABY9VNR8_9ACTN|nr:MFS transporter [Streptomyces durocortorensis]WNF25571.1 MFS transporter [Streptomyces durocortorensis]